MIYVHVAGERDFDRSRFENEICWVPQFIPVALISMIRTWGVGNVKVCNTLY